MPRGTPVSPEEVQRRAAAMAAAGGSFGQAAMALGMCERNLRYWWARALSTGIVSPAASAAAPADVEDQGRLAVLSKQVAELHKELAEARRQAVTAQVLREIIHGVSARPAEPPAWVAKPSLPGKVHRPGTPVLFLSDLHWGEVVNAAEMGGRNEYNSLIAARRLRRVVDTTISLLTEHMASAEYPGIVVPLGGDLVSGAIHEELVETNDQPMPAAMYDCADTLCAAVRLLADTFGHVYCPCVVGNHGRLTKKPRAKCAPTHSWDWMIGEYVRRHFANDPRVVVHVSDELDLTFKVQNTTFLLTHGDQFRGGSGIAGPIVPWMIGDSRKRRNARSMNRDYDVLMMGHWHFARNLGNIIVNGSLKGFDEYAARSNFDFQDPQQILFVVNPDLGPIWWNPVKANEPDKGKSEPGWVSWPKPQKRRAQA